MSDFVEGQTTRPLESETRPREKHRPIPEAPKEKRRSNIGPYKLERRIEGGKAECWLCTDSRDGTSKFLKKFPSPKMPSEDDRFRDRVTYDLQVAQCTKFLESHQSVARDISNERVGNGSLVRPLDAFWHESSFFKIYPFISNLDALNSASVGKWDAKKRVLTIRSILLALRELHDRDIVHGDIKLENIHLVSMPSGSVARLIDFDDSYRVAAPPPPTVLGGTEDYYSPEVLVHKGFATSLVPLPLGTASDIFSLSLAVHEAFSESGRKPRWANRETADAGMRALAGEDVRYEPLGTGKPLLEYRLQSGLSLEPRMRPSVSELLSACGTNLGRVA